MHILVCNDDGIDAPGIHALAQELKTIATGDGDRAGPAAECGGACDHDAVVRCGWWNSGRTESSSGMR